MAGNRLFRPSENLDVRPPTSNAKQNGNIINPPRYAEFGGLKPGARGIAKNEMSVNMPGGTIRDVPQKNTRKPD